MTFQLQPNVISIFLNKVVINQPYLFINLWSIVHLCAGLGLGFFIKDWKKALGILISYEIFEIVFWKILFVPETPIDILLDIVIGMIGYFIGKKILKSI